MTNEDKCPFDDDNNPFGDDSSPNKNTKFFKVTITPEKYRVLPSRIYKAKLCFCRAGVGKYKQPIFCLYFLIIEGKYTGRRTTAWVNQNENGQQGKLWQLARAISGENGKVNAAFYIDALIDGECFINVEQDGKQNTITQYISFADMKETQKNNAKS